MKIYLVGGHGNIERIEPPVSPQDLKRLNCLVSMIAFRRFRYAPHEFKSFMLDSGAFSFLRGASDAPDWDKYLDRYIACINENAIDLFFELDIDPLVGYEKVKEFRARLVRETGKFPIPVWHKSRGRDEWLRMCSEYPYVAIGGFAIKVFKPSEFRFIPYLLDEAHKRGAKVHGLGFTWLRLLDKYPFDSVDSNSWTAGSMYGNIYKFHNGQMKLLGRSNRDGRGRGKGHELHRNNFYEWLRYAEYMEAKYSDEKDRPQGRGRYGQAGYPLHDVPDAQFLHAVP